jgi:hypothetical protein
MTAMITASFEGQAELIKQLQKLAGPELKRVVARSTKTALQPVVSASKTGTPQITGRLEGSLAQTARSSGSGGWIASRVGMMKNYTFVSMDNEKLVTGSGKRRDKALAKGFKQDQSSPLYYGRLIEFGHDKKGRVRRKAGGAHMLSNALSTHESSIISVVAGEIRRHLETTK